VANVAQDPTANAIPIAPLIVKGSLNSATDVRNPTVAKTVIPKNHG
jgi:hypothetical protein